MQAARALDYAHERGVVHGDVKPSNLLLNHEGTVKVLEVGLARIDQVGDNRRDVPVPTGLFYLAPEQRLDPPRSDARSDVYGLGCVLSTLLAGAPPLPGPGVAVGGSESPGAVSGRIARNRADLPEALGRVLEKMTAKRPEDRLATMKDVLAGLAPFAPAIGKHAGAGAPGEIVTSSAAPSPVPTGHLGEVVTLEKSKHLVAKFVGGISATIIAPVVVALVLKYMDNSQPPPPVADGKSATATDPRPAEAVKSGSVSADAGRPAGPATAPAGDSAPDGKSQDSTGVPRAKTKDAEATTVAGAGSPAAVDDAQAGDWQDVVPTIYPPLDVLKGGDKIGANRWERQADGLHFLTDAKAGKLRIPVEIRGADLEFDVDFTAIDQKAAFVISAPFANGFVWVNFGGDRRAPISPAKSSIRSRFPRDSG